MPDKLMSSSSKLASDFLSDVVFFLYNERFPYIFYMEGLSGQLCVSPFSLGSVSYFYVIGPVVIFEFRCGLPILSFIPSRDLESQMLCDRRPRAWSLSSGPIHLVDLLRELALYHRRFPCPFPVRPGCTNSIVSSSLNPI